MVVADGNPEGGTGDLAVKVVLVGGGLVLGYVIISKILENPAETEARDRYRYWIMEYEREYELFIEDGVIDAQEQQTLDWKEEQITIWYNRLQELGLFDDIVAILAGLGLTYILIRNVPDIVRAIKGRHPPKQKPPDIPLGEEPPVPYDEMFAAGMPASEVVALHNMGLVDYSPTYGFYYLKPYMRPIILRRDYQAGEYKIPVPVYQGEFAWYWAAGAIIVAATVAVFAPYLTPITLMAI